MWFATERLRAFCIMSRRVTLRGKLKSIDVGVAKASPNRRTVAWSRPETG